MGWIGWTEEQTLNTTMPGIEAAYHGRMNMLGAIFGTSRQSSVSGNNKSSLFADLKRMAKRQKAKAQTNG